MMKSEARIHEISPHLDNFIGTVQLQYEWKIPKRGRWYFNDGIDVQSQIIIEIRIISAAKSIWNLR